MNTWLEHKDTHKFIWNARGQRSIIDCVILNQKLSEMIVDYHVFRGSEMEYDPFMLVAPSRIQPTRYKKQKIKITYFYIKWSY
jgi:hypothetical protein